MPRGKRERFRIKLRLARPQRMAWDVMCDQARAVELVARERFKRWRRTLDGGTVAREFFADEDMMVASMEAAPDLSLFTIEGLIDRAWRSARGRSGRGATDRPRGRHSPEFDVPREEVAFSTVERTVRVPYLGTSGYGRNAFVRRGAALQLEDLPRRIWLAMSGSDHVLVLDYTDLEEAERRDRAHQERMAERRRERGLRAVDRWLGPE